MGKANRSRPRLRGRDNQLAGLVFVLPFLIGFFVIAAKLFVSGLQFAFSSVSLGENGIEKTFVGLKNFYYILRVDPVYAGYLQQDIRTLLTTIPIILIFSLFVAVVLNKRVWGRTVFRAIFFLPVIVATGLLSKLDVSRAGSVIMQVMNEAAVEAEGAGGLSAIGDITAFLQSLNFSPGLVAAVSGVANNVMEIINRSGVQILIFLAGIQSISPSIYESASVEGATAWETFWKITLPMVSPMIVVNVIYTVIESLTRDNTTLMGYINSMAFGRGEYGYAAAMAWLYCLVVAVLLIAVVLILRKLVSLSQRER